MQDLSKFLPLPPPHFEILLSLAVRPHHGYGMVKDIRERTGGVVDLGLSSLYAAIRRLMRDGLVEDAGDQPRDESAGPPRKYYRLTRLGRAVAKLEAERAQTVARTAKHRLLDGRAGR